MATFSILTASMNQGDFLAEAIKSVAASEEADLEHTVIDGGSVDNSLAVLGRYDQHVDWLSEPDRGYAHAVNKALARTSGEIIGWLNADDVYYPNAIRRAREFFAANEDVDILYGDGDYIDEDGDLIAPIKGRPWSLARLRQNCFFFTPSVFFRRRVVQAHGLLDEGVKYQPDYDLWLRLAAAGARFAYLPERLGACRVHAGNRHVWSSDLSGRMEAAEETIVAVQRHFGRTPLRWLLSYGRLVAEQAGLTAEHSLRFDTSVLRHAIRRMNKDTGNRAARILRTASLIGRHVGRELENMVRRPHLAARLLPPPLRNSFRNMCGARSSNYNTTSRVPSNSPLTSSRRHRPSSSRSFRLSHPVSIRGSFSSTPFGACSIRATPTWNTSFRMAAQGTTAPKSFGDTRVS